METQKNINLLNGSDNENSKFATKKWYIIDNESKGNYSHHNPIKFLTKSIESSLCDYFDAYILLTGNINVTGGIIIQKRYLKIVHHLKILGQKLMILLLIMQILLILRCLCII